jgi:hypothetical protein
LSTNYWKKNNQCKHRRKLCRLRAATLINASKERL